MLLLLPALATAGPIFLTTTGATQLDVNGNWPRAFPTEGGWHVFNATQGEYHYQFVYDDLTTDRGSRRDMTGHSDLQDHSIALCPDGTWFHVASASHVEDNDSAYLFRYDADLNLLSETTIADGETTGMFADLPGVCGENFRGVGYWPEEEEDNDTSFRFVQVDEDGNEIGRYDLDDSPASVGSSLVEDDGVLYALGFYAKTGDSLLVTAYDLSLATLGNVEVDITTDPWHGYWAQGVVRVGDTWLVAHMAEDSRYDWGTQGGDLWLTAFDLDWNMLETVQLSYNTHPEGGMQPALAVKDDQVLVLYTYDLYNWAFTVTVDLAAMGAEDGGEDTGGDDSGGDDSGGGDTADTGDSGEPDDSGAPDDSGTPDDTGDSGDPDDAPGGDGPVYPPPADGCACASGANASPWALGLGALALLRRRRRA